MSQDENSPPEWWISETLSVDFGSGSCNAWWPHLGGWSRFDSGSNASERLWISSLPWSPPLCHNGHSSVKSSDLNDSISCHFKHTHTHTHIYIYILYMQKRKKEKREKQQQEKTRPTYTWSNPALGSISSSVLVQQQKQQCPLWKDYRCYYWCMPLQTSWLWMSVFIFATIILGYSASSSCRWKITLTVSLINSMLDQVLITSPTIQLLFATTWDLIIVLITTCNFLSQIIGHSKSSYQK